MITNTSQTQTANIQIVDDNPENLTFLSAILTKRGYEVRTAINGSLALNAAQKHPPDLILLDIMMPKMSGHEVCKRLKADERTRDIPVIFISALDEVLDKVKAFSAGGIDYITKPFHPEEVFARIETHLLLRKAQKQIEEQNIKLSWELSVNAALSALYKPLSTPYPTLEDITTTVLAQAQNLTGSKYGFVSSIDPVTGDNVCHTMTEMLANTCRILGEDRRIVFPQGDAGHYPSLLGYALNTDQAFYTNAPATHPSSTGTPEGHILLERFLSIPVMLGEELVGQIALANAERDYTEWDVEAIRRLAEFYTLAIQRRRAEENLRESESRLAVVEEREIIGRELHDDLGQVMSSMSVRAQAAQELMNLGKMAQAQATLAQLVQVSDEANDDVRQYILGIRTSEGILRTRTAATQPLPDFLTTLDQYLDQLRQRYGLDTRLSWPDNMPANLLAPEVETQLLRIIQESLTNVRKHAGVEDARLLFTLHPDEMQVVIADEGRGVDVQGAGIRNQESGVRNQRAGVRERGASLSENIQGVESMAERRRSGDAHLPADQELSRGGAVRPDSAEEKSGRINSIEHRRGMGTAQHQRVYPLSGHGEEGAAGVGDPTDYRGETELSTDPTTATSSTTDRTSGQNAQRIDNQPVEEEIGSESLTPSFGLGIMRERAEAVGGSLELRSFPGEGTQVIVHVPRVLQPAQKETVRGLRVLLVDDHPLYLEGLHNLLVVRGVQVVGMAPDGLEAQELARKLLPDLILMDVVMPRCNGLEATRRIKAELPDIKIVMLTVATEDETLFEALKYGASGYLLKSLNRTQFFNLLTEAMRGETVLSPTLASRVLAAFKPTENIPNAHPEPVSPPPARPNAFPELNPRQAKILTLVALGLTYKEIGDKIFLSEAGVKYHMGQILKRLQLKSRREATVYAQKQLGSRAL